MLENEGLRHLIMVKNFLAEGLVGKGGAGHLTINHEFESPVLHHVLQSPSNAKARFSRSNLLNASNLMQLTTESPTAISSTNKNTFKFKAEEEGYSDDEELGSSLWSSRLKQGETSASPKQNPFAIVRKS